MSSVTNVTDQETMTYVEAAKLALAQEMRRDPTVWALGEDLGRGGIFGQYRGLVDEFGPERIADAPISEAGFMGVAVGAAMTGMRPVVEMRIADFALCAADEMINQAAKARYMFGGQARVPLVIRQPTGFNRCSAAQHSQSLEALYTHIPGLVVVAPSTPACNHGLLKAAIRADDPVIYFEHKELWGLEGAVPAEQEPIEIGPARLAREGGDVTVVTWSAMVHRALEAAEHLAGEGLSVEVVDLRTLWPWDRERVLASVDKTRRLLVAHEAVRVGGFGGEIAATVAEEMHDRLLGPVRRLGAPRMPAPYAPPLEEEARIGMAHIVAAIKDMCRR